VTLHYTSYHYDSGFGEEQYDGITLTGFIYPNKAILTDGTVSMHIFL